MQVSFLTSLTVVLGGVILAVGLTINGMIQRRD